jgi:hypothetical protein
LGKPPSVLFFTTHKCSSTFIPPVKKITKNSHYKFKDYAGAIRSLGDQLDIGQNQENFLRNFLEEASDELFFQRGDIYASLRFPVDFPGRSGLKHIFFLRDPRDALVSSYYSFTISHTPPKNSTAKKRFQEKRELAQKKEIDDYVIHEYYVIHESSNFLDRYLKHKGLLETSNCHLYLRYDEFQNNTVVFVEKKFTWIALYLIKKSRNSV